MLGIVAMIVVVLVMGIAFWDMFFSMRTGGVGKMLRGLKQQQKQEEKDIKILSTRGEPAMASIVSLEQTGWLVNDEPQVKISLRVHRGGGQPPYEAEMIMAVPLMEIPNVQPGKSMPVLVDPENPGRVGPMPSSMIAALESATTDVKPS